MKSTILTCLALFAASFSQAQTWNIETLRSNINGAWSRTADFDLDGDPDILVQAGDTIYWYENLRPGWTPHVVDPTFYNSTLGWVDVLDIDGDGDMDIIKAPISITGTDSLTWNENQSNGALWEKHTLLKTEGAVGWMQGSYGDLDDDGDLDIVVPEYDYATVGVSSLYWLENQANTSQWIRHDLLAGSHWYSSIADMDGDGDLDITAAWEGVFWLENQLPATTWTKHVAVAGTPNGNFLGACSDLNDDGKADIVSAPSETSGGLVYFANPAWTEVPVNTTGQNLYLGVIGDIDGDGDPDVTYGGAGFLPQGLGWSENQNDGANWVLHDITPHDLLQRIPTGLADIDGDGDTDIVSLTFDFSIGLGSAFWAANPQISVGVNDLDANTGLSALSIWPNPFSSFTTIHYQLEEPGVIRLSVYNQLGQQVRVLNHSRQDAGIHTVTWDGQLDNGELASQGVYSVRLETGKGSRYTAVVIKS